GLCGRRWSRPTIRLSSDRLPTGPRPQNQRLPPTTKPPDLIAYILGMDSRSTDNIHSFASTFLCVVRGRRLYCFLVILSYWHSPGYSQLAHGLPESVVYVI
ncbi:hypothetical protein GQ607_008450, partial [Colletotrichum asianum]